MSPAGATRALGLAALLLLLASAPAGAAQRYAIVVGNNSGQPFSARLWFSVRDADRLSETLVELGHFERDHVLVLRDQSVDAIRNAFADIAVRVRLHPTEPALLVFYYSGHATTTGLEVADGDLLYTEVRSLIAESPAQTKIAIVDACDSGSLTRVRGGRPLGSVDLLGLDAKAEGIAYISSTAIGEAAQESAALQGGFFTTNFEAALRGAADTDHDGQVTLTEAFRYSASHTTADTVGTEAGPQHPTYTMRLSGRGEVVLTDLRTAEASLLLPAAVGATYTIHGPHAFLGEVPGQEGVVRVAVPSGHYDVDRRYQGQLSKASVDLKVGAATELQLTSSNSFAWNLLRGSNMPLHAQVSGLIAPSLMDARAPTFGTEVSVNQPYGPVDVRLFFRASTASIAGHGGTYQLLTTGGGADVLWPLLHSSWLLLEAGPEFGVARVAQMATGVTGHSVADFSFGASSVLTFWAGPVRVGPRLALEGHTLPIDEHWTVRPQVTGSVFVGF
jgi:hypothetical protein